jgi:hypothetical protein
MEKLVTQDNLMSSRDILKNMTVFIEGYEYTQKKRQTKVLYDDDITIIIFCIMSE